MRKPLRYAELKIAEGELHQAVAELLDKVVLLPAVWTTFPAGWGKLTRATSGRLKGCGLKAGIPDILIFHNKRTFGIELKTEKGQLSKDQADMFPLLINAGMTIDICRSVDDVLTALRLNNIPVRNVEIAA